MTQKKGNNITLIAGVLFVVWLLLGLFPFGFSFYLVLRIVGIAAICFSLLTKRRDIVLCVGFAILGVISLIGAVKPYSTVFSWLDVPGYIVAALICVAELTDFFPQLREVGKKIWFVPAILFGINVLYSIYCLFGYFHIMYMKFFVSSIIRTMAVLLSVMWVAYPDGLPNSTPKKETSNKNANAYFPAGDEMYCGLVKHILLLLFTFGIWLLIWIYHVTGYTNCVKDEEERNPTTKLLLCMFVPFYQIYWTYKTAQRIDKMALAKGLQSEMPTLCLILAIFVPIIPPILMQDKLNNIATAGDVKAAPAQKAQTADRTVLGTAEELKNYKELLDSGVITQEEFDAKKKQLLGL